MIGVRKQLSRAKTTVSHVTEDVLHLFYPNICVSCGRQLTRAEEVLCLLCQVDLPETGYHRFLDNPVARKFWGRVELQGATALYHFRKGSMVQHVLHQLKYNRKREVGLKLGRHFALQLKESVPYRYAEVIVPVPLHKKKEHKRGYNQSAVFAEGLSKALSIPIAKDALRRNVSTTTQTRKARIDRWDNIEKVFELNHPQKVAGKHVMLVDDVITTGATIEACGIALLQAGDVEITVVAMASVL